MVKTESIVLRVDQEVKSRIQDVASKIGKTATTFILEAAEKEARRIEKRPPPKGVHGGVPAYFKIHCVEASRGGSRGYEEAGYHLAIHIDDSEIPDDLDFEEWSIQIKNMISLLDDTDLEGVWEWFNSHYPKCMKLVPRRRMEQFINGVIRAWDEERISF